MKARGWIRKAVLEYLSFRRGLGYEMRVEGDQLLRFAAFADGTGHRGPLTIDLALRWASGLSRSNNPRNGARRLDIVRRFARHLALSDRSTEVPPQGLLGPIYRRKPPHIYTPAEIRALMREAGRITSLTGLRPHTYRTILGLLASTGLRISEVLRLTREDVDFREGLLTVRLSKFRKSRLVPLHPSAVRALRRYALTRDAHHPRSVNPAFFLTERGTAQKYHKTLMMFTALRRKLGWTRGGTGCWPRLHDFRHTFAVRRLLAWHRSGAEVENRIVSLSTYLGHTNVEDTYWYLSATPELMGALGARFEGFARGRSEVAR